MNRSETLLVIAMEECSKIQQAISKALRFGMGNHHPDQPEETNGYEIIKEYAQLKAVMDMLLKEKVLPIIPESTQTNIYCDKIEAVEHWSKWSKQGNLSSHGLSDNITKGTVLILNRDISVGLSDYQKGKRAHFIRTSPDDPNFAEIVWFGNEVLYQDENDTVTLPKYVFSEMDMLPECNRCLFHATDPDCISTICLGCKRQYPGQEAEDTMPDQKAVCEKQCKTNPDNCPARLYGTDKCINWCDPISE